MYWKVCPLQIHQAKFPLPNLRNWQHFWLTKRFYKTLLRSLGRKISRTNNSGERTTKGYRGPKKKEYLDLLSNQENLVDETVWRSGKLSNQIKVAMKKREERSVTHNLGRPSTLLGIIMETGWSQLGESWSFCMKGRGCWLRWQETGYWS